MENKHTLIIGKTGCGKSYLLKQSLLAGKLGGRVVVIDMQNEYPGIETEIDTLFLADLSGDFYLRLVPEDYDDIIDILRIVFTLDHVVLIAEEISEYSESREFRRILQRGRRKGLHVICLVQRPAEMSRTVSSQCATGIVFFLDEPRDLDYIRNRYGSEAEKEVKSLQGARYECALLGEDYWNFFS